MGTLTYLSTEQLFSKKKNAIGSETVRKKREKEEETKAIKAKPGSTIMEMTVLHRTAPY